MKSTDLLTDAIRTAEEAARSAGSVLLEMQGQIVAREKAPADLVTAADLASQRLIFEILSTKYPDFAFLGEEETGDVFIDREAADYCWIVDPLDGTTNYVHGMDSYCVSIGLRCDNNIVAGVIYDPNCDKLYSAIRGEGAYCNGVRLQTSSVRRLGDALVVASFPAKVRRDSEEIDRFLEVLVRCQALRRLGSAALNMCFVAAGKLDAYWATSVKSWDIAAGLLLIEEAGGIVTSLSGADLDIDKPRLVAGANVELHSELLSVLQSAQRD